MASGYTQAVTIGRDIEEEKQKGIAEAGEKQLKTEEFKIDKKIEYDKKAKKAAEKFGKWQKGLGTLASLAAVASGAGAPLAAAMAGGGSMLGGVIGQKAAQKEMAGMDWLNKEQSDLFSGMRKSTGKKALTSAVMAGVTAHGAGAGGTEAGAELSKTGAKSTGGFTSGTPASERINLNTGEFGASKVKETGILQKGSKGAEVTSGSISKVKSVADPSLAKGGLSYGFDAVKQYGWKGAYSNLKHGAKSLFSDDVQSKMGMGNTLLDYYNAQENELQGP